MIQNIKPNNKVLIMSHKDSIHPEVIGKQGTVKLIHNSECTDFYYIKTNDYFEDLPPYIAVYDELALIE